MSKITLQQILAAAFVGHKLTDTTHWVNATQKANLQGKQIIDVTITNTGATLLHLEGQTGGLAVSAHDTITLD